MNRSDVIKAISYISSLTQAEAKEALDAFIRVLQYAAESNEDVTISGLGKFTVRNRQEAERVNPGTGEKVVVPERKTVTFKASKAFKSAF